MKNLKIGKKLFISYGIIVILYCITVFISLYSLTKTGSNFTAFYDTPYVVTNEAATLSASIQEVGKYIGYAMMENDENKTAAYVQSAQDSIQKLRDGTAFLREHFPEATSIIDEYDATMKEIKEERDKVLELALENKNSEAIQLYFEEVMPEFITARDYLLEINAMAENQANTYYGESMSQKTVITIVLVALSIITLFLTIWLALYITRSLTQPIKEIEKTAKEMADGSLNVSISYESKDELGSLANSMQSLCTGINAIVSDIGQILAALARGDFHVTSNCLDKYIGDYIPILSSMRLIRDNLNETLTQINESADQVASGSDQVSSGAQALSQGTTEQASSIEELAATINEISTQVTETANNAIETREQTGKAGEETSICNQQMQEMISAMDEISHKSTEIGKIIKTIEDIAFQTNILALNAAVEAARAGTAGKGFAVVADEVRNLASKSAEASKNTSTLIAGSIDAVEKGRKIVNETADSLLRVVESSKSVAQTVDKIAEAAHTQATSIAQVTQGIDQISSVVQTNSATAEESAAASEELSGQAQILKSLTGRFKLLNNNEPKTTNTPSETVDYQVQSISTDSKY